MEKPKYIPSAAQQYALEAAVKMRRPLLITGEPGTGKTQMATWALDFLSQKEDSNFYPHLLQFNTKTTSRYTDLMYQYDALGHFQAANLCDEKSAKSAANFIQLEALGKAIAISDPTNERWKKLREDPNFELPDKAQNTVVLIDEVDKAPKDFTNDLLHEFDGGAYEFQIRELLGFGTARKNPDSQIVLLLTSNSEKSLPDAFLRRCAFFHIEFPKDEELRKIVEAHLQPPSDANQKVAFDFLLRQFEHLRELDNNNFLKKKPATAELLDWMTILIGSGFLTQTDSARRREMLRQNLPFLIKTSTDWKNMKNFLDKLDLKNLETSLQKTINTGSAKTENR